MPKLNLDLDKVKGGTKLTIGQIQKLPHEEQVEIFKPIVEANAERIASVFGDVSNFTNALKSITNVKPQLSSLLESIRLPEIKLPNFDFPEPELHTFGRYTAPPIGKSQAEIERELREDYVNKLHIQLLEKQLNIVKGVHTPQYDISTGIISFMGHEIEIPLNTNLEMVCRIVLKNMNNMSKRWSWDEVVEEARENRDNFTSTQIYTSARAINEKVAQETTIKDFLVTKPITTVRLNPKFVPK